MINVLLTAGSNAITFKDIMPWLLTIFFGCLTAWVTSKRDLKKETKDDTYTIASMAADIKNIEKGVSAITQENKELRSCYFELKSDVIQIRAELDGIMQNAK